MNQIGAVARPLCAYGAVSPNRILALGSIFLIHFQAFVYIR